MDDDREQLIEPPNYVDAQKAAALPPVTTPTAVVVPQLEDIGLETVPERVTTSKRRSGHRSRLPSLESRPTECPPPYTPYPSSAAPFIACRICQALINVRGKLNQHVVKCSMCNENTPIKEPDPGKKYVRCPCNCLLVSKATAVRVACPRSNCRRVIDTRNPQSAVDQTFNGTRVQCCHCSETFLFNMRENSSGRARCNRCHTVSPVGTSYPRRRCCVFVILGIVILLVTAVVVVATLDYAEKTSAVAILWFIMAFVGICLTIKGIMCRFKKVSQIVGPVSA